MRSPSSWRECVKGLAELAEKASGDAKASLGVFKGQNEHLDIVTREWGADGTERRELSEAITALEKHLHSSGGTWRPIRLLAPAKAEA
jgi:hypothetical protein